MALMFVRPETNCIFLNNKTQTKEVINFYVLSLKTMNSYTNHKLVSNIDFSFSLTHFKPSNAMTRVL